MGGVVSEQPRPFFMPRLCAQRSVCTPLRCCFFCLSCFAARKTSKQRKTEQALSLPLSGLIMRARNYTQKSIYKPSSYRTAPHSTVVGGRAMQAFGRSRDTSIETLIHAQGGQNRRSETLSYLYSSLKTTRSLALKICCPCVLVPPRPPI